MISQFQSQYPNITVSGIYYMDELDSMKEGTAEKLGKAAEDVTDEEVIQQILAEHPNAKGCIGANEETTKMLIDACEASESDDIRLIGFDGGETLTETLEGRQGRWIDRTESIRYGLCYSSSCSKIGA